MAPGRVRHGAQIEDLGGEEWEERERENAWM